MTLSFYKLHVSGDDFLLVDRDREGHERLAVDASLLPALAEELCDRRRAVGGQGVAFVGGREAPMSEGALSLRLFLADGSEAPALGDPLLCAARWAFDGGRASGSRVRFETSSGLRMLEAVDSRSFRMEVPAPRSHDDGAVLGPGDAERARLVFLIRGRSLLSYRFDLAAPFVAALPGKDVEPGTGGELRQVLESMVPDARVLLARPGGEGLVRFSARPDSDRMFSAAAAAVAVRLSAGGPSSVVAELAGKSAAVAYADLGADPAAGGLIDRGRFYVEWKDQNRLLVTGRAEYSFAGYYDWYPGQ